MKKENLKGTWIQAIVSLLIPLILLMSLRWLIWEPFVVPSGSMIPTLLVHDHIMVDKWAFGVHWPFTKTWIWQWDHPKKGDVVVFRYPAQPEVFFVKRVVAVGGDSISMAQGVLSINKEPQKLLPQFNRPHFNSTQTGSADAIESEGDVFAHTSSQSSELQEDEVDAESEGELYFKENNYIVQYDGKIGLDSAAFDEITLPEGYFFVMGDHRNQSSDSRVWGLVPESYLIGKAAFIWMACENTLTETSFFCDPRKLRWNRFLKGVH